MDYKDNQFWWQGTTGKERAERIFTYIKRISSDQSYKQDQNFRNLRLYGNMEAFSLKNYGFYRSEPASTVQNRITLNIVQSMVDTVVSKITKNKPKPSFLTEGGDWQMQRRAQKLTQFVEGQFQATNFYAKRAIGFQNSCIFGTGPLKIFREEGEIKVEQTFIDEIIVDDAEALYGEPRQMHQRKKIHRDVLCSMYPKLEQQILMATSAPMSGYQSNSRDKSANMVTVAESWRLPTKKDAGDGMHVICIEGLELASEEWSRSYFPFLFWRWGVPPLGFFGQGLAEQLTGLQLEINKILRTIQISMHLVSVPKIFVEASSRVVSAHLNNKIGGIIKYSGQMPTEGKLGTIPAELFSHLDRLYSRAFEIAGVSQLSANAQKPAGLNSGKALREFSDIESERFMSVGHRDEDVVLQASAMFIDCAKEIYETYGEYKVKVSSGQSISILDWSEVNMEEDQYVMRCFPTSALASTPSGKLQDVQELLQAGFISKEDGMKLLDFPDLRQFYNFNNAGLENIEKAIEEIIEHGNYETPEPYQNLQLGIQKMQQAYLMYKTNGAPEARLELFRRWIEDAGALLSKAQQPPPGQLAAPAPQAGDPQSPTPPDDPSAAGGPQNIAEPAPGSVGTIPGQ